MLSWLKKIKRRDKKENSSDKLLPSIFAFISNNIDENGRLKADVKDLPDEPESNFGNVTFAPGLFDGLFPGQDEEAAEKKAADLAHLMDRIAKYNDEKSKTEFYALVTDGTAIIDALDSFLDNLVNLAPPIYPNLYNYARYLMLETDNRNAVKIGVAISGICKAENLLKEIKVIGLHDEFTLFSMVAITNISKDIVNDLFEMAQKVDGWGKIRTVERLAPMKLPAHIKKWLITEGYKNNIMYEYLAFTCAMHGDLHKVIQGKIDELQFKSAAEIIEALLSDGPAENIYAYPYANVLIENFIRHAAGFHANIFVFTVLHKIREFLTALEPDADNGWTDDTISNCLIDTIRMLDDKTLNWERLAIAAISSDDDVAYWDGITAAKKLGIPLWDIAKQKVKEQPLKSARWYDLTQEAKPENLNEVLQLAMEFLPLDAIVPGLMANFKPGSNYSKYQSLDYVLMYLQNYPAKGETIVLAGLNSALTSNRISAVNVLKSWGEEHWSAALKLKLHELVKNEPSEWLKNLLEELLKVD